MKILSSVVFAFFCLRQPAGLAETNAITIEPAFPAPPESIIDLFVPPTRSKEPFAASSRQVFQFRPAETNWVSIYSTQGEIWALDGYAKSSSVLYAVGSEGLAATRDGGKDWAKVNFPDSGVDARSFVGISVNPTNRREALVTFTNRLFLTRDSGETLSEMLLPGGAQVIRGGTFAGTNPVRLAVLTSRALLISASAGSDWISLPLADMTASLLPANTSAPQVLLRFGQKQFARYDLAHTSASIAEAPGSLTSCSLFVPDLVTDGLFWASCGNQVRVGAVIEDTLTQLGAADLQAPPRFLRAHPRQPGQAFVVLQGANPIVIAKLATNQNDGGIWGFSDSHPLTSEPAPELAPTFLTASPENLIARLAATEPPLDTVIAAALTHAKHNPEAIDRWQKRARTRNWIPELRVSGGVREYTVDRAEHFEFVDRFGVSHREDLRLSDDIEPMGYAGVTLVWDLSRVFFDRDEIEANKEKRAELKQRNDLIAQLTTLYYERIDLLARKSLRGDKMTPEERISVSIKIRQKTDILNQLIGSALFAH